MLTEVCLTGYRNCLYYLEEDRVKYGEGKGSAGPLDSRERAEYS